MARINRFGFVAIALVFHIVYLYSIFDIYFVSPIVHGMKAYPSGKEAPAQRLVLFVGDGLRADKAFQSFPDPSPSNPGSPEALEPRPLAPFLRTRIQEHGTFGVSHTRVPTESRPGHVALIAGLYEDVSAVTTGWKLNPVNFDSVFNRSRHTWSWGSPDILPMFKEGAVPGRVYADSYSEDFEDFTSEATQLDTWVFDRVEAMFSEAASNSTLDAELRQDKSVFFLHLLGLDTTGHAYRPYSKEYLHNIKVVDQGVEKMTKLMEDFYDDGQTAFVFTADHGMSDWGSHGDGHPDNTRTPLIAWGSGVAKPQLYNNGVAPGHADNFSYDWGLDHVARHDVAQADVAALMAYLVGLEYPVNSVGEVPLPYLAAGPAEKAEATLANAQQILEMYRVKEEEKRTTEINYRPYPSFGSGEHSLENRITSIRALLEEGQHELAISESQKLLQLGIGGLRYLQTYDWLFLRALVTVGYLGWIAFATTTVIDLHVLHGKTTTSRTTATASMFGAVLVALFSILFVKKSPVQYYAYAAFPVIFWEEVFARRQALTAGSTALLGNIKTKDEWAKLALSVLASIGLLEALALSYFQREMYTVLYLAAVAWPLFYGKEFIEKNILLILQWAVGCVLMSSFTLLPAMKVESMNLILVGGFLMLSVGGLYLLFDARVTASGGSMPSKNYVWSRSLVGIQVGLILLALIVTRSSVLSLQAKQGLPAGNQVVGWAVLVASLVMPFLHNMYPNKHYIHRLVVLFLTFSPSFVILTISYEGLLYFSFCLTLVSWVRLEHHIYTFRRDGVAAPSSPLPQSKSLDDALAGVSEQLTTSDEGDGKHSYRALALSDFRIALFFLFFLQSGFFSTGNIASVSAFSLDSVYRLIPIFSPFSQGALLTYKLMIPFAVISANLGILNRRLDVAPSSLFMVVMAISDVLTMNFFWLVKDEGSWLDIGTSITNFFIASLLCVFVSLLEFISEVFVGGVEVEEVSAVGETGKKSAAAHSNGFVAADSKTSSNIESSNGSKKSR